MTNKHLFCVCFAFATYKVPLHIREESKNSTGYKFMTCENDMDRDSNKKHFISFFFPVYFTLEWIGFGETVCFYLEKCYLMIKVKMNER